MCIRDRIKPHINQRVIVDGSLKPAAPKLKSKQSIPLQIISVIEGRKIFTLLSSHQEDEKFVIHALQKISKKWN